ncbi:MAG: hypothetical protein RH942_05320 [Kiloniellaceae bacterium]
MNASFNGSWLTGHRGWEDFLSAGLGVLIVLSPSLVAPEVGPIVLISAGLAGILITMLALLEIVSLQRWEEVLELACGIWVALAPLALDYSGSLRLLHFALGGAVALLALLELWQDRNRRFEN